MAATYDVAIFGHVVAKKDAFRTVPTDNGQNKLKFSLNGKSNKNSAKTKHLTKKKLFFTGASPSRVLKRSEIRTVCFKHVNYPRIEGMIHGAA